MSSLLAQETHLSSENRALDLSQLKDMVYDSSVLRQIAGGKAHNLVLLAANCLPVPSFVVVPPQFLSHCYNSKWSLTDDLASGVNVAERIRTLSDHRQFTALARELATLSGPKAVRSSAISEDGALSFAGQLASFLNVADEQLAGSICDVYASAFERRVLAYRKLHGIAEAPPAPAVIVQSMVAAACSGVAFSVDPVSGAKRPVVSMVAGLAEQLVSGQVDGSTFYLDELDDLEDLTDGMLTRDQGQLLLSYLERCEKIFGCPQDIEFAIDQSGALYLVQARAITTLDRGAAVKDSESDLLRVFDGSNIQESYPGVTSPLTFSFISSAYKEVYKSFVRLMGVGERSIEKESDLFANMLAYHEGRVYYNLGSWYRLLAMLPAYQTNRTFMEGMMGLKDSPAELAEFAGQPDCSWAARTATLGSLICILKNYLGLDRQICDFNKRLEESLCKQDPETLTLSELLKRYRLLERNLLGHWQAPVTNDFFAMIAFGLLTRLHGTSSAGASGGYLYNLLLKNHGGIVSAEPPRLISEMAAMVAREGNTKLIEAMSKGDVSSLALLKKNPDAYARFNEYIEKFGDRAIGELKLEVISIKDNPGLLLAAVGKLAIIMLANKELDHSKPEPIAQLPQEKNILKRLLLPPVAQAARQLLGQRENLRFARTRVFGEVRRIFLAMGSRLEQAGVLNNRRDIFYLTLDEVFGYIDGSAVALDLGGLVTLRRKAEANFGQSCPERISFRGAAGFKRMAPEEAEQEGLTGLGAASGKVIGLARVIVNPEAEGVEPGEIIIADHTDPGWILHFASCAGIVVAHGSQLSHTAIVARELGIAAVVSCRGVMQKIKTGDLIEVDGSQGTVTILKLAARQVAVKTKEQPC
jgi:phosphohistidine swiveling domain-containing protein